MKKNLKNLQPNGKLDHRKISFFVIKEKKVDVNYKLELLKELTIHPIFYILLLKFADSRIPISTQNPIGLTKEVKYKVEKIIGYNPKT